uniref:Glutamate receptor-interacting protein 2 n=1 Tax=Cacopsylla melanoneura TaxID=428564 RepID=A0A8D8X6R4_9HEMI
MFSGMKFTKNKSKPPEDPIQYKTRESSGPPTLDLTSRGHVTMPVVTTTKRCNGKWSINKVCAGLGEKSLGCNKHKESTPPLMITKVDPDQISRTYSPLGTREHTMRTFTPSRDNSPEEYEQTEEDSDESSVFTYSNTITVVLERDNGSLGITLRGGLNPKNPSQSSPIIITHIKPDGPVDREGTVQVGDRLVAVDNQFLSNVTLKEAQAILCNTSYDRVTKLCIEYDISIMNDVREPGVPLLVEVESPRPQNLGLTLVNSMGSVLVNCVKQGSIAERCGALLPGDEILAINETLIEGSGMTAEDVHRFLTNCGGFGTIMKLEILPKSNSDIFPSDPGPYYNADSYIYATPSLKCLKDSSLANNWMVSHKEHLLITLQSDENLGFGISLKNHNYYPNSVVVSAVEVGSPADKCGCIQTGDQILSINQRPVVMPLTNDAVPLNNLVNENDSLVTLEVEFTVADTVVPTSGVFTVKLAKNRHSNLGITIQASGGPDNQMIISEIGMGSVAHRSGTLIPGDRIMSVNNHSLQDCSIEQASDILHSSSDVVTLVVQKDNGMSHCDLGSPSSSRCDHQRDMDLISPASTELDETCSTVSSNMNSVSQMAIVPPPCPLQTDYQSRNYTLPNHRRRSSLSDNIPDVYFYDDSRLMVTTTPIFHNSMVLEQPEFSFNTFCSSNMKNNNQTGIKNPADLMGVFQVTLFKDCIYEDFGFSVSDGLYERGVFINRIRPGGPADLAKPRLRPYDRILQVNDTRTGEFDCCLTVPLIAAAGDCITLTVMRQPPRHSVSPSIATSKATTCEISHHEQNKKVSNPR